MVSRPFVSSSLRQDILTTSAAIAQHRVSGFLTDEPNYRLENRNSKWAGGWVELVNEKKKN